MQIFYVSVVLVLKVNKHIYFSQHYKFSFPEYTEGEGFNATYVTPRTRWT